MELSIYLHSIMSSFHRLLLLSRFLHTSRKPAADLTVWWDSSCPLCLREIAWMKKRARPGTIEFVDIGSSSSNASCPIDRQTMLARFHAQERNGPVVDGAEAFALLWKHIPRLHRMGLYMSRSPRTLQVFEWFYTKLFLPYLRPVMQRMLGSRAR